MEKIKPWIPVLLALVAGAYALERRLAAIEHAVAVVEWRLTYHHGEPPWRESPKGD